MYVRTYVGSTRVDCAAQSLLRNNFLHSSCSTKFLERDILLTSISKLFFTSPCLFTYRSPKTDGGSRPSCKIHRSRHHFATEKYEINGHWYANLTPCADFSYRWRWNDVHTYLLRILPTYVHTSRSISPVRPIYVVLCASTPYICTYHTLRYVLISSVCFHITIKNILRRRGSDKTAAAAAWSLVHPFHSSCDIFHFSFRLSRLPASDDPGIYQRD